MSTEPEEPMSAEEIQVANKSEKKALRVIGWFSIGMAVAALSIYLGYEVRSRYKFRKRTPYDFYSNSGEQHISEFGMGI
ncbi:MAG: hypothetical protein ABSG51_01400 [Terracidiphilus sp.]|jgi:hypothetical protein